MTPATFYDLARESGNERWPARTAISDDTQAEVDSVRKREIQREGRVKEKDAMKRSSQWSVAQNIYDTCLVWWHIDLRECAYSACSLSDKLWNPAQQRSSKSSAISMKFFEFLRKMMSLFIFIFIFYGSRTLSMVIETDLPSPPPPALRKQFSEKQFSAPDLDSCRFPD